MVRLTGMTDLGGNRKSRHAHESGHPSLRSRLHSLSTTRSLLPAWIPVCTGMTGWVQEETTAVVIPAQAGIHLSGPAFTHSAPPQPLSGTGPRRTGPAHGDDKPGCELGTNRDAVIAPPKCATHSKKPAPRAFCCAAIKAQTSSACEAFSRASSSKHSWPSTTETCTRPPWASLPNSSSSASGRLRFSWITRAIGRAPIFGS
jgi:hypothetical protein